MFLVDSNSGGVNLFIFGIIDLGGIVVKDFLIKHVVVFFKA